MELKKTETGGCGGWQNGAGEYGRKRGRELPYLDGFDREENSLNKKGVGGQTSGLKCKMRFPYAQEVGPVGHGGKKKKKKKKKRVGEETSRVGPVEGRAWGEDSDQVV